MPMTTSLPRFTSRRFGKPLGVAIVFGATTVDGEGEVPFVIVGVAGGVDGTVLATAVAVAVEITVDDEIAMGGSYELGHSHHPTDTTTTAAASMTRRGRRMYRGTGSPPF